MLVVGGNEVEKMSFQSDEHTGHRLGKYELLCRMAVGGMAEIFLGFGRAGPETGKPVVLKRMLAENEDDTEALELLLQEARQTARLKHPNVVKVLDLEVIENLTDKNVSLIIEFIPGLNLEELAEHFSEHFSEPLPLGLTLALVRGAALGLNHAHNHCDEKGQVSPIIHRDVTPRNIILSFDGRSKVLDFGIARIVGERRRTAVGMVRGTSSYMSPEQATDQPLDIRTDIFSLGVVFHELLTGERLFSRGKALQDMMAVFQGAISLPSQTNRKLPRSIDNLVLQMLERSLDKRFQTMGSFVEKLDKDFATEAWTEKQCKDFMQEHFSKRKSDIEAMLARIDVSVEPSTLIQRRPFEDAQTVIHSRSLRKQEPLSNREYDADRTALIDGYGNPLNFHSEVDDTTSVISSSSFLSHFPEARREEEKEEEKEIFSPTEMLEESSEADTQPSRTALMSGLLEIFRGPFSLRGLFLGSILLLLALGMGWWCGNKGYLQQLAEKRQLVEERKTSELKLAPPVQEEKPSEEKGNQLP